MFFLTYNDAPSGIYFGQVTDVCNFIRREYGVNVKLIAFVSIRDFFASRKQIRQQYPHSLVLPSFPRLRRWRWNIITLFFICLLHKKKSMIARGPFAANLALVLEKFNLVKKVCFDGRGASFAELTEYKVVEDNVVKDEIYQVEQRAVLNSDFRIAVSQKLVDYWKEKFHYQSNNHIVIPCTLSSREEFVIPAEKEIIEERAKLGYRQDDILLVYSGSMAQWQSLAMVDKFLEMNMGFNQRIQVIFLSKIDLNHLNSYKLFAGRVRQFWLPPAQVKNLLYSCDYGILIREKSVTNQVASPTKFAEYLACGLPVIITESIGDYSEFVRRNNCGRVVSSDFFQAEHFTSVPVAEKLRIQKIAISCFSKKSFLKEYQLMIDFLEKSNVN